MLARSDHHQLTGRKPRDDATSLQAVSRTDFDVHVSAGFFSSSKAKALETEFFREVVRQLWGISGLECAVFCVERPFVRRSAQVGDSAAVSIRWGSLESSGENRFWVVKNGYSNSGLRLSWGLAETLPGVRPNRCDACGTTPIDRRK